MRKGKSLTVHRQTDSTAPSGRGGEASRCGADLQYLVGLQRVGLQVVPMLQVGDVDSVLMRDLPEGVTIAYDVRALAVIL